MSENSLFRRTDLAYESCADSEIRGQNGIVKNEYSDGEVRVNHINIVTEDAAKKIGRPVGQYVTVLSEGLWSLSEETEDRVIDLIAKEVREMAERLMGDRLSEDKTVLVCGLGNDEITADAIGPKALSFLYVTRHMRDYNEEIYRALGSCAVCALRPGVVGQTGIETAELIRGTAEHVSPDLVIIIDALAARSTDRLATTVQLSDTGIEPGSGIGNKRKAINRDTLGVPVIAVGVPTVIDSSSLVYDALQNGGITQISGRLRDILENGRNFFVSLKESDTVTRKIAYILSEAINSALSLTQ